MVTHRPRLSRSSKVPRPLRGGPEPAVPSPDREAPDAATPLLAAGGVPTAGRAPPALAAGLAPTSAASSGAATPPTRAGTLAARRAGTFFLPNAKSQAYATIASA